MPRAFHRARLARIISTSAIAGLASFGFLAATASADVNSVRIDPSRVVEVDNVVGVDGLRVFRYDFNSGSDTDAEAPDDASYKLTFVNSV